MDSRRVGDAVDLHLLHAHEEVDHLVRLFVGVNTGFFEGEQQFMGSLYGRKTPVMRLLFDKIAALLLRKEHNARQILQTGAAGE